MDPALNSSSLRWRISDDALRGGYARRRARLLRGDGVRYALLAAGGLLLAAAAACTGEEAAATPTPSPTATVATLPVLPPHVEAEALASALGLSMQEAAAYIAFWTNCQAAPYDVQVTAQGYHSESRYSGEDFHTSTTVDYAGQRFKDEMIAMDGVIYLREMSPDGRYGAWRVAGEGTSPNPICIHPSEIPQDADLSEPISVTTRLLSPQEGEVRTELWVDSDGRPVRKRDTYSRPPRAFGPVVFEFTYSGWGEPNVITAPEVASAP